MIGSHSREDVAYLLSREWEREAACQGRDVEMWYPLRRTGAEAERICRGCPVRAECYQYSLLTEQQWGTWGGVGQRQRRKMIFERRQLTRSNVGC